MQVSKKHKRTRGLWREIGTCIIIVMKDNKIYVPNTRVFFSRFEIENKIKFIYVYFFFSLFLFFFLFLQILIICFIKCLFFCMFLVDLTNGQLTPNNNTPLLTQALSGKTTDSFCKMVKFGLPLQFFSPRFDGFSKSIKIATKCFMRILNSMNQPTDVCTNNFETKSIIIYL